MALPLLLRGEKLSLLERASTLSASQTPDAIYPLSNLYDTRPSQLFIFPTRAEDDWFMANVDQYLNGDFENWTDGLPNNHTVNVSGSGAVTEETTSPIFTGSSSMQMVNGASGTAEVLQSIEVLAGDSVELRYASQTSSAGSPATLEIFNPYTGKWLTTAGTWSSRRQNAIESALTSMDEATLSFTVEEFADVRKHSFELELRYHMDDAAVSITHHWDAVRFVMGSNFASIHAHNMSAGILPRLVRSDDDLSAVPVDRATAFANNGIINRAADFTGNVDDKEGTVFFTFKLPTAAGTHLLFQTEGARFSVTKTVGGNIEIEGQNSAGTPILRLTPSVTILDDTWYQVIASWSLATATTYAYIDGVSDNPTPLATNDTIDYTRTGFDLGSASAGGVELGEIWYAPGVHINLSVATNRLLFRTAGGDAAVLGENGELVTGTAPILYWVGDGGLENKGTGGNFDTITGTIAKTIEALELTKQDVSFYGKLSSIEIKKYWKLHLRGTNAVDPLEVGQWVLGPAITPAWSPRLQDNKETRLFSQSRAVVESSGEQWAVKKAKHPRRTAQMRFNVKSPVQAAFRDELLARTSNGADPIVIVEDQNQPKVIHGRIPPGVDFLRRSLSLETTELIVEESSNGIGLP